MPGTATSISWDNFRLKPITNQERGKLYAQISIVNGLWPSLPYKDALRCQTVIQLCMFLSICQCNRGFESRIEMCIQHISLVRLCLRSAE